MDDEARRAVVAALVRLAESPDYRDRADAGRAMASFADLPETRKPLHRLLLDPGDTYVTLVTATALLRRMDAAGLTAVAAARAGAGDSHANWLGTAVHHVFDIYADERDAAVRQCDAMVEGAGPRVRRGAARLRDTLTSIDPVLWPVDRPQG
ncbi:hypothetical protein [Dactylosporangium sp. NPDC050588]|uniref:hypothetical protein n=1 Tax=Dactylosporangium sp. NPDC050588 TaxID=3157211 RepID=UPI0033D3AE1E